MIKITFIEPDGTEHVVDAAPDKSLMEAAMHNGVPRIDADCGGMCACATCHVYIDPEWFEKTGEREGMEEVMLDYAEHVQPTSRLSCQVKVTAELDGLIVRLPESQH